jgi:hypothetical protein
LKSPRFVEDLGRIIAFFFWNGHIYIYTPNRLVLELPQHVIVFLDYYYLLFYFFNCIVARFG